MMHKSESSNSLPTELEGYFASISENTAFLRGRLEGLSDTSLAPLSSVLDRRFVDLQQGFTNVRRLAEGRGEGDVDAELITEIARQLEAQFTALRFHFERLVQWLHEMESRSTGSGLPEPGE